MSKHLSILNAAADNLLRFRTRSLVIVFSLLAILSPFLIATAVFDAVKRHSRVSIEQGADLYVSASQAGRNAPIPVAWADRLGEIPGVIRAVPRIVGRDSVVGPVTVVGVPLAELPDSVTTIAGRLPHDRAQVIVGRQLSAQMNLTVGKSFTLNVNPGLRFKVVGLFDAASPIWSARLIFMDLRDAQEAFAMPDAATEILVYTRPGYADPVYDKLNLLSKAQGRAMPLRVVSKRIAREMLRRGFSRRGGVFSALYLVAFALAIPSIAVASGLGFSDRRREIGLYRATGWHTHEVLEMVLFENLILSATGATAALSLSILWMKLTNGLFIAQFFLPETGMLPGFPVPTRFLPMPALLAYLVAMTLTLVGSLYHSYRTAIVPPLEAIR